MDGWRSSSFLIPTKFIMLHCRFHIAWVFCIVFSSFTLGGNAKAEEKLSAEQVKFFEGKVRPLLFEHCQKCHGKDKQSGGLRLDSLSAMLGGGESGAALVRGKPEESLLVEAVNYASFEMPPGGKLDEEKIAILTAWVKMGAPWPGDDGQRKVVAAKPRITDEDRKYWAFQPVKDPTPPAVNDQGWCRNDIDRFIFQQLHQNGLEPSAEANRLTLIRRATFDLTGLPPTPAEVDDFLNDSSPEAYEKLIDRLLASPRYGEKWARHWLDLVRFAETDGWRQDAFRPAAYRYRDYVIKSFNEDKPYDRFVLEQLAGDELFPDNADAVDGTMYLRHWTYEWNQRNTRGQWSDILNDVTDVTSDVFLGLGLGCARCHDHKFDPLLQRDYFRLQAFFTPILPREDFPVATQQQLQAYREKMKVWEEKTAEIRAKIDAIVQPDLEKVSRGSIEKFPEDIQAMIHKPESERDAYEHQIATLAYRQVILEQKAKGGKFEGEVKKRLEALQEELAKFDRFKPAPLPTRQFVISDAGPVAPPTFIPGDRKQEDILPGFLTILHEEPATISPLPTAPQSTGRRAAFAKWVADAKNPLSTRVITNRVWQYHFGMGLVVNSSDFGTLTEPPSHPELLDWLTTRFLEGGWTFKRLHRQIMTSATYRQSSIQPASQTASLKDPGNRLLWRQNMRRLESEPIRDAILAATGELDLKNIGGASSDPAGARRSIYTKTLRNAPFAVLDVFDGVDGFFTVPQRNVTTTSVQSLLMINGPWMLERAAAMAQRLEKQQFSDDAQLVKYAFRLTYGREPTAEESAQCVSFLQRQAKTTGAASQQFAESRSGKIPKRDGRAVIIRPDNAKERLKMENVNVLPTGDFTIETIVVLGSVYDDASVRTIAAQWDSNQKHSGWSLGVTSKKSKYNPRNVILQLVGDPARGQGYEVIPSNIHLELNRPYYVGVSVKLDDKSKQGVTFYVKDLSDDTELLTANATHQMTGPLAANAAFTVGGRDEMDNHSFDGLIDDVRLTRAALTSQELLLHGGEHHGEVVGFWQFDKDPGFFRDSLGKNHLREVAPDVKKSRTTLVDFTHVLLNSSEFLYVE